jgi:hypothetical protein
MRFFRAFSQFFVSLSVAVGGVSTLWGTHAVAEQRELPQQRAAVDAVLLLDSSGSMLKTDAQKLRFEGAKLFFKFLGDDDRFAIVTFSDKAKVVSELKEFKKENAESIVRDIDAIKTEGQYSDILEGVKASAQILEASPRNDAERVIILLSDGKMEPNPAVGMAAVRTAELVNQVLPELKTKEVKVHSLAFSSQADKVLLGEIAAVTDGLSWFTGSSEDVHKSFADLFLAVKRPQVVPMRSRGFTLDGDVDEATFYITRDEGSKLTLVSPKGTEMTVERTPEWVTWFAGKNFDVITMHEPDIGEWQVHGGVSAESFATVLTNLKLVSDWPVFVRAEERAIVQARLYDGEKPVALPEMSGVIRYAFQITPTDRVAKPVVQDLLNDEGRDGDKIAKDGIFSRYAELNEPGEYKLSIVARGPTFERTQQVPFRVKPQLIRLEVVTPEDEEEQEAHHEEGEHEAHSGASEAADEFAGLEKKGPKVVHGDEHATIRAELSREALTLRGLEVRVEVVGTTKKKIIIPLKRSAADGLLFEVSTATLPADGTYSLRAIVSGETKKRQEIEAESNTVRFNRTSTKEHVQVITPEPEKEKEPEEKEEAESFPILPIALISVANILAIALGLMFTKKPKVPTSGSSLQYSPPKQVVESLAALEAQIMSTDMKIGDVVMDVGEEPAAAAASDEGQGASEGSTTSSEAALSTETTTEQAAGDAVAEPTKEG